LTGDSTLQRRVEHWCNLHGPAQAVIILQTPQLGVLGTYDLNMLEVQTISIAGMTFEHRLIHFRLPYSGGCHVAVIHGGESFVALPEAMQNALLLCGRVPTWPTR
jgi:hypothetical protein